MTFSMRLDENPDQADTAFIQDQLRRYNVMRVGEDNHRPFAIFLRDQDGQLAGGLLGATYWGWLVIEILWVREDARRQGYGQRLLAEAEAEAVRRGCLHAHLDTTDFQAPDFYKKHGYTVWGVLEDIPPGHQRIFLRKNLVSDQKPGSATV